MALPALATAGDLAELKRALSTAPERVNEVDGDGFSALMCAVGKGDLRMVTELLSTKGIAIDLENRDGLTACHAAALCGHVAIVRALAEHRADVHEQAGA